MSPRLPAVSARRAIAAFQRAGFVVDRTSGSHCILVRPGAPEQRIVVPMHSGRDLPTGTLRAMIRQAGLTVEAFTALI